MKRYSATIIGVIAFLSVGAHASESSNGKKTQCTLTGGIGTTKIDFGSGGSDSPDEKKYMEELSSGTTFTGMLRLDYFEYLSVNLEMNYFNSRASFANILSENISIYTPSIGLFGKYPIRKSGVEIYAGAGIGFVIFEDKVEIDGDKVTLSSPQPGYMANLGFDYFPFKYLGLGLGVVRHWSSVDDIYSNYGDHADLEKEISLDRTEYRARLSTRFFLGSPKQYYP